MSDEHERPTIIIRRVKKIKRGGHHGGSWKIAYADFVTAMMAFFLLMWLLGLMNKYELQGVAEYFKKPLKEAFQHSSNQRGTGPSRGVAPNKEKNTEKNTEKNVEKGVEKEKPAQADEKSMSDKKNIDVAKNPLSGKTNDKANDMTQQQLQAMKAALEQKIAKDPIMSQYKNQLNFEITADGLKITLHDLENKQMFTTGKADFQNYAKTVIAWLSQELNTYPNRVMIIGHTDTVPFSTDDYTNWELSADRANAARRALVQYGLNAQKIIRVVGVSDTQQDNQKNGKDPSNRRIEIILLTDQAMKKLVSQ